MDTSTEDATSLADTEDRLADKVSVEVDRLSEHTEDTVDAAVGATATSAIRVRQSIRQHPHAAGAVIAVLVLILVSLAVARGRQ